ncbi:hypothetical protein D3C73_336480 [compost metagenome]
MRELSPGARNIRVARCQWMIGGCHRNQLDTADAHSFDTVDAFIHGPTDADDRATVDYPLSDGAEGLHVQVQGNGRERFAKGFECVHHALGGKHYIEYHVNLGFEPLEQALHFGA